VAALTGFWDGRDGVGEPALGSAGVRRTSGAALLLGLLCGVALRAQAVPPAELPNHVILLIDDSLDARHMLEPGAPPIVPAILEMLYARGERTGYPALRPGHDRLSLVFFTIHKVRAGCSGSKRLMSASLDGLFEGSSMASAPSRAQLGLQLADLLTRSCRWAGYLSPIATAPQSVLPFVQKWLPAGSLYRRTIIVLLTNDLTNTGSPATELAGYEKAYGVADVGHARSLVQGLAERIRLADRSEWDRKVGKNFEFHVQEALPVALPDEALTYSPTVRVDARAVSRTALRLAADRPDVALRSSAFTPLSLSLHFSDTHDRPWRIGSSPIPSEVLLDLQSCRPPACSRNASGVTVRLLEAALPGSIIPADGPELKSGVVRLRAGFRLRAPGLYEALFAETGEKTVQIGTVPSAVVQGHLLWPFAAPLGNRGLASWYRAGDGELTREQARRRVETAFARRSAGVLALLVAAVVVLLLRLVRRRFAPALEWQGREPVEVSVGVRGNRVLVGSITVRNRAPKPLLSRFGLETSPRSKARLTAVPRELSGLGLVTEPVCLIGFPRGAGGSPELTAGPLAVEISDSGQFFLFLAGEHVVDIAPGHFSLPAAGRPEWSRTISIEVRAHWDSGRGLRPGSAACIAQVDLRGIPQPAATPRIAFLSATRPLHFAKGSRLEIGRYLFYSMATRHFAVPFRGAYHAQLRRGEAALGGDPVVLAEPTVEVAADPEHHTPLAVAAMLLCDGAVVPHPDAESDSYSITLLGPAAADSALGPHPFELGRDLRRAELIVILQLLRRSWEIFWEEKSGHPAAKLLGTGAAADEPPTLRDGCLWLAAQEIHFERQREATYLVLAMQIGNSASAGSGRVEATLTSHLEIDPAAIHVARGAGPDDLVGFRDATGATRQRAEIAVAAGDDPAAVEVLFFTSLVKRIPQAVVAPDACRIRIRASFAVADGQGAVARKELTLLLPLRLEQLPDGSWLCIDFGTSAITAALGSVAGRDLHTIDLQRVSWTGASEECLAQVDPDNSEAATSLLPSTLLLDGDIRKGGIDGAHPGTPYARGSTTLDDPAFLSLPALSTQLRGPQIGRVVESIKSWLTRQRNELILPEAVTCKPRGGELRARTRLPLDEVLQTLLSALVEGFLAPERLTAEQFVLTHPNTFTSFHRARLRRIAFSALSSSIGFPRAERIHLMSESDAVAYYYCHLVSKGQAARPSRRVQNLLVYDCGSGTLDLSLINVRWSLEEMLPVRWTVRARIGVGVAGDHLDEALRRIVDDELRAFERLKRCRYETHYPVVAASERPGKENEHRQSVFELARAIRKAKRAWKGDGDFEVTVGLRGIPSRSVVDPDSVGPQPAGSAAAGATFGYASTDGPEIVLRLAAASLQAHPRIATLRKFVTTDVIDELLAGAARLADDPSNVLAGGGCDVSEIDVVLVSGRGALWPGLREAVWARFPHAECPRLSDEEMKRCVATGAVAWHELSEGLESTDAAPAGTLGLLHADDTIFVPVSEWSRPTALLGPTFRFVQANCQVPNPKRDLDRKVKSLRQSFYVPLADGFVRTTRVRGEGERVTLQLIANGHERLRVRVASDDSHRSPTEVELEQGVTPPGCLAAHVLEPETA
jgi:hypothetical protein